MSWLTGVFMSSVKGHIIYLYIKNQLMSIKIKRTKKEKKKERKVGNDPQCECGSHDQFPFRHTCTDVHSNYLSRVFFYQSKTKTISSFLPILRLSRF